MGKTVQKETKVAVADGFYGGRRLRKGETFVAPEDAKAKWFKKGTAEDVVDDLGGANILGGSVPEVREQLAGLTDEQLDGLVQAEQAGERRKGVLAAIADEKQNRVGRIGGNDPKAKQPEETDPKTPNAKSDTLLD